MDQGSLFFMDQDSSFVSSQHRCHRRGTMNQAPPTLDPYLDQRSVSYSKELQRHQVYSVANLPSSIVSDTTYLPHHISSTSSTSSPFHPVLQTFRGPYCKRVDILGRIRIGRLLNMGYIIVVASEEAAGRKVSDEISTRGGG